MFDLVPPTPKTNKHLNLQVGWSNATQGRARSCAGGGGDTYLMNTCLLTDMS